MELRNHHFRAPILSSQGEGNIVVTAHGEVVDGRGGVREPVHACTFQAREPGDPIGFLIPPWPITKMGNDQKTLQTVPLI